MESIRSEHHVGQWFDSLPLNIKRSLIRQFYHLYCKSDDGDLRTTVNTILDKITIDYSEALVVFGEKKDAFKVSIMKNNQFKEFVETIGA